MFIISDHCLSSENDLTVIFHCVTIGAMYVFLIVSTPKILQCLSLIERRGHFQVCPQERLHYSLKFETLRNIRNESILNDSSEKLFICDIIPK